MDFAFKIFEKPIIAFCPLAFILAQYFAKVRFPLGPPDCRWSWYSIGMDSGNIMNKNGLFQFPPHLFCGGEMIDLNELTSNGVISIFGCKVASDFAIGYCSFVVLFIAMHFYIHGNDSKLSR